MTDVGKLKKVLDEYVIRTVSIRRLSAPQPAGVGNADGFISNLRQNAYEIEKLAKKNKQALKDYLYPILSSEERLDKDVCSVLGDFCEELLNPSLQEEVDLTLLYLVSERLLKNAEALNDDDELIKQSRLYIYACYNNMVRINRIRTYREGAEEFQKKGLLAAERVLSFLDISSFKKLADDAGRHRTLIMANFYTALYDTFYCRDEKSNSRRLDGMKRFLKIAENPEYLEAAPDFNWNRQKLRCLENMGQLTENGNLWNMSPEQCKEIALYMDELEKLWYIDPIGNEEHIPRFHFELLILRNSYYSGRISVESYRSSLSDMHSRWSGDRYDNYGVMANLLIPSEYLATIDRVNMSEEMTEQLRRFYSRISGYLVRSEGIEAYSSLLDYLCIFLERFVEIPGEYEFEQMALNCMAAVYPEGYIHSLQVAGLSRCLCEHLLRLKPSLFTGIYGCDEQVATVKYKSRILDTVYHSALCHDIGKISMVDTYEVFGRELTENESRILKMHADMSAYYLGLHRGSAPFAEIAGKHHAPAGEGNVFVNIISAADSLAVKTGRADISSVLFSFQDIAFLASDPVAAADISFLLKKGRENYTRDTYLNLSAMQDNKTTDLDGQLKEVMIRTMRIRTLSAPQIEEVRSASGYRELLRQHFKEIGMLSVENIRILERILYPILDDDRTYTSGELNSLIKFCGMLLDGQDLGDFDQALVYRISGRLLKEVRKGNDTSLLIKQLDIHISSCYEMMHQAKRMRCTQGLMDIYREEGLEAAGEIWSYLDKEKYDALDDDSKALVMINARYAVYLYETDNKTRGIKELYIDKLTYAYHLADDPFYAANSGEYDWNYHRIRSLEYLGQSTECGNSRDFSKNQCGKIADMMEKLKALWDKDPEGNEEILPGYSVNLLLYRNRYYAGRIGLREYRSILRSIHLTYRNDSYDFNSVFPNLQVPTELILSYEGQKSFDEDEKKEILGIYRWVIRYVFRAKNSEAFALLLEYFSELLWHYIELPGEMSFRQMGLYSMAALHPPTYIHSMMVGQLSECICRHMLRTNPAAFIGLNGYATEEEVTAHSPEIIKLCFNAALCHDFGKIPMIDTIFVYGRKLLDPEFALLKNHPKAGADMLLKHESTRRFADVALGHHKWYDGSRGYPEDFDIKHSPDRILISIVTAADCLDAATDSVGRSYSRGKSPSDVFMEIINEAGTRYSPDVAQVLSDRQARKELTEILDKIRDDNYEKAFYFIKEVVDYEEEEKLKEGYEAVKMIEEAKVKLDKLLIKQDELLHAYKLVSFDQQTLCPEAGIEEAGNVCSMLYSEAFRITKQDDFIECVKMLHENADSLNEWEEALVKYLYRRYLKEINITQDMVQEYENACRQAWVSWKKAREENDYSFFADSLSKRVDLDIKRVRLFNASAVPYAANDYDRMLDENETGMTTECLDGLFSESSRRIRGLMDRIAGSGKRIRTDFMSRPVSDDAQKKMTEYLLDLMGFDLRCGMWGETIHPFTERIGRHDTRVTTHFDSSSFLSNIYTVIHECGHALFEQQQPEENHKYHIADFKTMGQHESVSRFYENIIGRSESFIRLIYPKACEIFPEVMKDVSVRELYEAVNLVTPSLIRTDADELTYTLHIVIRYELEKAIVSGDLTIDGLPDAWKKAYEKHLGVKPSNDLEGVLQDVHWSDGFGYFPTYALGNFYGGMYLGKMCEEFDPFESLSADGFARINAWMRDNVFKKADRLTPREWIRDITGRTLSADDYLDYLEKKYSGLYEL